MRRITSLPKLRSFRMPMNALGAISRPQAVSPRSGLDEDIPFDYRTTLYYRTIERRDGHASTLSSGFDSEGLVMADERPGDMMGG